MTEAKETGEESPQENQRKEKKKSTWTLEKCMRAARRYATREEWAQGAPSSYKAACARGWDDECAEHMKSGKKKRTA